MGMQCSIAPSCHRKRGNPSLFFVLDLRLFAIDAVGMDKLSLALRTAGRAGLGALLPMLGHISYRTGQADSSVQAPEDASPSHSWLRLYTTESDSIEHTQTRICTVHTQAHT